MSDISDLPNLAAIFRGIKTGQHWCFGDPEYSDLCGDLFIRYRDFFSQLELTLHRDPRGFVYATSTDEDYKGNEMITRFVVFSAVWVDALADEGTDVLNTMFAPAQSVSALPHLRADAHRRVLAQVGIVSEADLQSTLRSLQRLGFVDLDSQGRFSLRMAFHRLLDVCQAASVQATPQAGDAAAPTPASIFTEDAP